MSALADDSLTVWPCHEIRGRLRVPGDKSISHRLAMLCALADGTSEIAGYLTAEDCLNTLRAMDALGARISRCNDRVKIRGTGGSPHPPLGVLDMGNSGTGIRLLAGLLAGQPFVSELTGDDSLRSRPMERIRKPLELMGARIELLGKNGCAPIRIHGAPLRGITYPLPVASAQVKSCILLAGLFAEGETTVIEPRPTRDHTERLLMALGISLRVSGAVITVHGYGSSGPQVPVRTWSVPGDFSSAAFWLAAAASRPGAEICVENVGLNPRRTAFLDVLRRMGAEVRVIESATAEETVGEPVGSVTVRGGTLRGTEVAGEEIPNLIDELPVVAALGACAEGETRISDAAELRVKESDRIAAIATVIRAFGVENVEEFPDGLCVRGSGRVKGGTMVDSRGDHRIAMAAAILSLTAEEPVVIRGVACVATSYPTFWEDLALVTGTNEYRQYGGERLGCYGAQASASPRSE